MPSVCLPACPSNILCRCFVYRASTEGTLRPRTPSSCRTSETTTLRPRRRRPCIHVRRTPYNPPGASVVRCCLGIRQLQLAAVVCHALPARGAPRPPLRPALLYASPHANSFRPPAPALSRGFLDPQLLPPPGASCLVRFPVLRRTVRRSLGTTWPLAAASTAYRTNDQGRAKPLCCTCRHVPLPRAVFPRSDRSGLPPFSHPHPPGQFSPAPRNSPSLRSEALTDSVSRHALPIVPPSALQLTWR